MSMIVMYSDCNRDLQAGELESFHCRKKQKFM
jgi:hypothetical protein